VDNPLTIKSARTLHISYNLPINRTSKFWQGLTKGKIYATKCQKCRKIYFPPVADCGECGSSNLKWSELDGKGEIETFTQVVVKPASFSEESNYIVAIAKLKEGVRALAWLTGVERKDVQIGMKIRLVADVTSKRKVSYKFIPI
jgi:uncharacterized OB-fold protein